MIRMVELNWAGAAPTASGPRDAQAESLATPIIVYWALWTAFIVMTLAAGSCVPQESHCILNGSPDQEGHHD